MQQSLIDPTLERPVGPIPLSVVTGNNADLIASVAPLYLTGSVLDVTYGRGMWWKRFTPDPFIFHDLAGGYDFRHLPYPDNVFDAVCFDPPYITSGGSSTTDHVADFRSSFGIDRTNGQSRESELLELIVRGLSECARVTNKWLLVKCMEYTSSRELQDVPTDVTNACRTLGLSKWDVIVHASGRGPGGHNIFTPRRARRAHSYLLVFRKGD